MIRLVAVDASTWWGGVALLEQDDPGGRTEVVAEVGLRVADSHAVHLLPLLDRLMAEAGWERTSVDGYASTRGPGSFTGVRVGLGTVRGLSLASGRPALGVCTLEALAEAYGPAAGERVPLLDAGRGDVYGARYDASSSPPAEVVPPWIGPPERALEGGTGAPVVFGPGLDATRSTWPSGAAAWTAGSNPRGIAAAAGRIALNLLQRGAVPDHGIAPLYLRPPDAEIATTCR